VTSSLLIWDSFKAHESKEIIEDFFIEKVDTDVAIIPGGCTPVLQPLDVGINKSFKDNIKKKFVSFYEKATGKMKKTDKIEGPRREDIINWIIQGWEEISSEIIINAFKKAKLAGAGKSLKNGQAILEKENFEKIRTLLDDIVNNQDGLYNRYLDSLETEINDTAEIDFEEEK
jgi:hypothetical protein